MKRMILTAGGWPVSIPPAGSGHIPADDSDADAEDEDGREGNETPRVGTMDYRDRRPVSSERHHTNTGGWGLGAGNEEKEVEDDDDETMNWDQAQVKFKSL